MSLRAENNVRQVNAKLDYLIHGGWKRLLEVQEIQAWLSDPALANAALGGHGSASKTTKNKKAKKESQGKESAIGGSTAVLSDGEGPRTPIWALLPRASIVAASGPDFSAPTPDPTQPRLLRLSFPGSTSTDSDTHLLHLLRAASGQLVPSFLFSHWHHSGDNFSANISSILTTFKHGRARSVEYDLVPSDAAASLDDLFAGEGTVFLRNDFDLPEQDSRGGRIARVDAFFKNGGGSAGFVNGRAPARYVPSFGTERSARIADLWKKPLERVRITYSPSSDKGIGTSWVRVGEGCGIEGLRASIRADEGNLGPLQARVWAKKFGKWEVEVGLKEIATGEVGTESGWICLVDHNWPAAEAAGDEFFGEQAQLEQAYYEKSTDPLVARHAKSRRGIWGALGLTSTKSSSKQAPHGIAVSDPLVPLSKLEVPQVTSRTASNDFDEPEQELKMFDLVFPEGLAMGGDCMFYCEGGVRCELEGWVVEAGWRERAEAELEVEAVEDGAEIGEAYEAGEGEIEGDGEVDGPAVVEGDG